jgi:hypothetical protein
MSFSVDLMIFIRYPQGKNPLQTPMAIMGINTSFRLNEKISKYKLVISNIIPKIR